jgi:hypothetical protein
MNKKILNDVSQIFAALRVVSAHWTETEFLMTKINFKYQILSI